MGEHAKILVLGIGNLLWADEGWGVRVVEELHRRYAFPENVRLMDGGTQGLYLVQYVCDADVLVVFDAIDYGLKPGTLKVFANGDVPKFLGAKKMSLHQTGFQEVIMTADLLGHCPANMLLIGVQPEELEDFGGSLRNMPKQKISEAIDCALTYLKQFGISAEQRGVPLAETDAIASVETSLAVYESGRPSEEVACRTADLRCVMHFYEPEDASSCA
jgi:hydrogenase maturation protease